MFTCDIMDFMETKRVYCVGAINLVRHTQLCAFGALPATWLITAQLTHLAGDLGQLWHSLEAFLMSGAYHGMALKGVADYYWTAAMQAQQHRMQ